MAIWILGEDITMHATGKGLVSRPDKELQIIKKSTNHSIQKRA